MWKGVYIHGIEKKERNLQRNTEMHKITEECKYPGPVIRMRGIQVEAQRWTR